MDDNTYPNTPEAPLRLCVQYLLIRSHTRAEESAPPVTIRVDVVSHAITVTGPRWYDLKLRINSRPVLSVAKKELPGIGY